MMTPRIHTNKLPFLYGSANFLFHQPIFNISTVMKRSFAVTQLDISTWLQQCLTDEEPPTTSVTPLWISTHVVISKQEL